MASCVANGDALREAGPTGRKREENRMDSRTFDRLVTAAAGSSRRGALRVLAAGLLGGVLGHRGSPVVQAAQRLDQDGDGLFDDDESLVYGTDPYGYDTDGDGVGDGEEVYYGTNPILAENLVLAEPPPVPVDGGEVAIGDVNSGGNADGAVGVGDTWGVTCLGVGSTCNFDAECCNVGAVLCCFDGTYLQTKCTDVTAYGGACL